MENYILPQAQDIVEMIQRFFNKVYKFHILILMTVVIFFFVSCKKDNPAPLPEVLLFPSKVIHKISVDVTGEKLFATEKGIIGYDGIKWTSYSDDKNLTTGSISDFVFERSTGFNKLWLGTNVGLSFLDFGATALSIVNYNVSNAEILADNVSALGIDDNRVKYIGTSEGLSILKNDKWDHYLGLSGDGEPLSKYRISSVSTAIDGNIYAATEGGGVSRFKYTDAVSGATTFKLPWAWGLPSDTVYAVVAVDTCQWYGTNRGVAYHASEYTKSDWITYTRADGLICDTVYAIAKDFSGNIWFGTHKGVSKLNGDKWQNFTSKDGLVANKVNAIAVDLDGSIWIGTDNGISHFVNDKWMNF